MGSILRQFEKLFFTKDQRTASVGLYGPVWSTKMPEHIESKFLMQLKVDQMVEFLIEQKLNGQLVRGSLLLTVFAFIMHKGFFMR